jgi:hypothetical protein
MRRENRKPTRREWAAITSRSPVVRRIPKPESEEERLDRIAAGALDAHLEDEDTFLRWERDLHSNQEGGTDQSEWGM